MIENSNFTQFVDYSTRENYSCETSGCYEEGICRCSVIEEVVIDFIDIKKLSIEIFNRFKDTDLDTKRDKKLCEVLWNYDYDQVNIFCVDRILTINKIWDSDNWFPVTSGGYYGEELQDILIQRELFEKVTKQIETALNIDSLEQKIFYLLELEYGKVLDNLVDKKMSIQIIDYEQIKFTQKSHLDKVKSKNLEHYKGYRGIKGLVRKFGDEYRVIDGYHRLYANILKKVSVIVVE